MNWLLVLIILLPAVAGVEIPLKLDVVESTSLGVARENPERTAPGQWVPVETELHEPVITGAVAYESSSIKGRKLALWLIIGAAAAIAVVLVLRR